MKKILLIIAVSFACTMMANAQKSTALDKKVRFGFKIDAGSSWLGPKEGYVTGGSKFYFGYGFISDFTLTDNYIISTGLNIINAGGKLTMQNGAGYGGNYNGVPRATPNTYSVSLQYVEIPFALKLKTDAMNGLRYWGQFGTYLGINIGSRLSGTVLSNESGVEASKTYDKEQITSATVPVNMGLDLGVGVEYPFNSKSYGSFGLGYHNGFIDITKQGAWSDGKVNLNGFFLRTAFFF